MALLTIGNTYRGKYTGISFQNLTGNTLYMSFLREAIGPGVTKSLSLQYFDTAMQSVNWRESSLYGIQISNVSNVAQQPFYNDMEQLCRLITLGDVVAYTTNYFGSAGTFVVSASATPSATGADGSVTYS